MLLFCMKGIDVECVGQGQPINFLPSKLISSPFHNCLQEVMFFAFYHFHCSDSTENKLGNKVKPANFPDLRVVFALFPCGYLVQMALAYNSQPKLAIVSNYFFHWFFTEILLYMSMLFG